jgi:hypothetical protein
MTDKRFQQTPDADKAAGLSVKIISTQSTKSVLSVARSGVSEATKHDNIHLIRESLKQERERELRNLKVQKKVGVRFPPLHPGKGPRVGWDIVLLLVILYCCVMIPVDLGLGVLHGSPWESIDLCILFFFSVDIVLNFNTCFYNGYGNLETRRCEIAKKYMSSWFILDFLSTFPWDAMLSSFDTKGTMLMRLPRIVKMLRLARLMRLARVQEILQRIFGIHLVTNLIVVFSVKFATLFIALMLICHWLACGFCAIATWEENQEITDDLYDGERQVGWTYDGINALDMNPGQRYQASLYFNFCAILMIKPSDIEFKTTYCRYFMMLIGFIKPVVAAAIMGVLTNMIVKNNSKRGALQLKKQTLGSFMQQKKVGLHIQHQVLSYLEHGEKQLETLSNMEAVQTLSPTLQEEVAYHTMKGVIHTFGLFEIAFGGSFVRQLCSTLKLDLFGPDDVICQEGHYMSRMFFVNTGSVKLFRTVQGQQPFGRQLSVKYKTSDDSTACVIDEGEISAGESFGSQALLLSAGGYSHHTAICFVFCELVFLTRHNFLNIVSRSPVWEKTLKKVDLALVNAEDPASVIESFSSGDADDIKALVLDVHLGASNRKAFFGGILRRAVGKIKQMKLLMPQMRSESDDSFKISEPRHIPEAVSANETQTSGFQTMQLSLSERCILQEISKVHSSLQNIEARADQRSNELEKYMCAFSSEMNSRISAVERKLAARDNVYGDVGKASRIDGVQHGALQADTSL